jgi:D-alanyl-lipoteichoic acid acyltransferase DltB (MBOAT superfamily)
MIFNSNAFVIFFFVVTLLYWLARHNQHHRDGLILISSFYFYGSWDWRFLGLLILTGGIDFLCAIKISDQADRAVQKRWLMLSIFSNIGTLGFFKYAGFFIDSAVMVLERIGISNSGSTLQILLPAGISFYTFQALSYTLDVYRGEISVERNIFKYFAFLTFFPQLVAGPIERASFLLPQFRETRSVDMNLVTRGLWFILWGFVLKVVIADYLAPLSDLVFTSPDAGGMVILSGTVAFGGQIYGDFAGYSLIAGGLANTMGFELSKNFSQPYFAVNIQDFWRRWHQTLSTWFRDYLYIPLGGDRLGNTRTYLNIIITFTLAGLWHGANWTFIFWGLCHGLSLAFYRYWRQSSWSRWITIPNPVGWFMTLFVVAIGWLFFRATSLKQAFDMIESTWSKPAPVWEFSYLVAVGIGVAMLALCDGFHRKYTWEQVSNWSWKRRSIIQGVLLAFVIARWGKEAPSFIYFQF